MIGSEGYFARVLLENLPSWLEEEIRANGLTICDWGCAEGEALESFRTRFPRSCVTGIGRDVLSAPLGATFDIVATSNGLQNFEDPWPALRGVAPHAARHLLILVPFRERSIATHIDPDFQLSSCKAIDCAGHPEGYWRGSQILLVYSRPHCYPHAGATFDNGAGISYATWQDRELSEISRRTEHLVQQLTEREAALTSESQYWRAKAAALEKQVEQQARTETDLRAEEQRLREEVAQLTAIGKNYATENQILASRSTASAYEAANLRRAMSDILRSFSWRITAPLRFISKPLFSKPATPESPAAAEPSTSFTEAAPEGAAPNANPLEPILTELRRAQSIAVIPCAVPFSAASNQRPISCARYLADHGSTVLFVAWQWSPEEEIPRAGQEVYPGVFHLPLYSFQNHTDSIAAASHVKSTYLCTLPSPGLVEAVRPLRAGGYHIHYDLMDDWEEFHRGGEAPWYSAAVEQEMVILSDTVTAVSDRLAEKFGHLRSDIAVVRNGYTPSALGCPQFIAARTPREHPKVIGYFGHLSDAWFDWEAVIGAAQKLPDVVFELIGYGLSDRSRARLSDFANIRFAGLVAQSDLHRYARKWWGGMIPFQASALSAAVDPLKIYEYLHLGLPTVVTGIPGIASYPLVHFASDPGSFLSAVDQLPGRPPDEQSLSEVAEFLKSCVWEERLARLNSVISEPAGLAFLYAE